MKKVSQKLMVIFAVLIALFLLSTNKVYAETNEFQTTFWYDKTEVEEVFNLVNQARSENGLAPLSWDYNLERAAVQRASELFFFFSHTRPDGRDCFSAVDDLGVGYNYTAMGENIAKTYSPSATSVMNAWMNSPGHRANILSENYNTIGIAMTYYGWVQVFGYTNAINSSKYITYDGQNKTLPLRVSDLYVSANADSMEAWIGAEKGMSFLFYVGSYSNQEFGNALSVSLFNANVYADNEDAIVFNNERGCFKVNDYGTYTVTVELAGKTASINVTVPIPDMTPYMFDSEYYANKYSDLRNLDEATLRWHWENYGINEGRQASPVFDPVYYLNNNQDLKNAFGDNYRTAMNHFISCGIAEFRKSSSEFWGEYYKKENPDLSNFSAYKLVMHYYNSGYKEGRIANGDISQVSEISIDSITFDVSFYRSVYSDLQSLSDDQLKTHWLTNGIKEGRIGSIIFDPVYYLDNNKDLRAAFGNNYKAALNHYQNYGLKEGRKASAFFDPMYYLNTYSDLKNAFGNDYSSVINHFLNYGLYERRKGSSTFDLIVYMNQNKDLFSAFGYSYKKYYIHYAAYGRFEGRITV